MAHSSMEPLPATTAPSTPYSLWASGGEDLPTEPSESVWTEDERDEAGCESAGGDAVRKEEAEVAARVDARGSSRASGDEERAMVTMVFMKMSTGGGGDLDDVVVRGRN